MKVDSSSVDLASQHSSLESRSVREALRFWVVNQPPADDSEAAAASNPSTIVNISDAAHALQSHVSSQASEIDDATSAIKNDPRMQLIIRMIEALTGRKVNLFSGLDSTPGTQTPQQSSSVSQPRQGFGLEYDYHQVTYEFEQTTFSAQGVISTADGQQIQFDLQLQMTREYFQATNVSVRAGDAVKKDPLVINFNGTAAQLTDTKFSFDLSANGTQDNVSFVGPGSGFLALDRNGNGEIDNGSELFGAQSGNGFADLAKYDADGNGWIDENDAIFAALRVWSKDAQGNDSLSALADKGVGALYLGNVASPFAINGNDNRSHGQVRSTGLYLNQDGSTGTLQQVDLAT